MQVKMLGFVGLYTQVSKGWCHRFLKVRKTSNLPWTQWLCQLDLLDVGTRTWEVRN